MAGMGRRALGRRARSGPARTLSALYVALLAASVAPRGAQSEEFLRYVNLSAEERRTALAPDPTAHGRFGGAAGFADVAKFEAPPPGLTVHVYDLPNEFEKDVLRKHKECRSYQWAAEVKIPEAFRTLPKAARAEDADFYLVPFPVKCYNNYVARQNHSKVNDAYVRLIKWVRSSFTYFDRSGGADHIFIFPSGAGPMLFDDYAKYVNQSIFLLAEGDRTKTTTNAFKDIIVPGYSKLPNSPWREPSERTLLASFRGNMVHNINLSGNGTKVKVPSQLRTALEQEMRAKEDVVFSSAKLPDKKKYAKEILDSKFLLCPRGITPWTRRVFDGLYGGAVPVLVSDHVELPFEAFIDWAAFSVKVSEEYAMRPGEFYAKLAELAKSKTYERKLRALYEARGLLSWAKDGGVINGVLWELERRKRRFKHGSARTWER